MTMYRPIAPRTFGYLRMIMLTPLTLPSYLTINHHRIVHELITHPVTPLPHLAFKNAALKLIREFGLFCALAAPDSGTL